MTKCECVRFIDKGFQGIECLSAATGIKTVAKHVTLFSEVARVVEGLPDDADISISSRGESTQNPHEPQIVEVWIRFKQEPVMNRRAFTLIEILVALTITMMMMGAVVTLFSVMSDSVSGSRSIIEMSERMRSCRNRLQLDLAGYTAGSTARGLEPPLRPENDQGYFEAIEGVNTDSSPGNDPNAGTPTQLDSRYGDTDDLLAFTTRSAAEPFVGLFGTIPIESQSAEVVWFLVPNGTSPPMYTLYRRQLVIAPTLTGIGANDDISTRLVSGVLTANNLGDLTKPENRWKHNGAGSFPFRLTSGIGLQLAAPRLGDDVILTNVLAFDVQLYDPGAPLYLSTGTPQLVLDPRDSGYSSVMSGTPSAYGAYVDLGYRQSGYTPPSGAPSPLFNLIPATKSGVTAYPFTFDTWSLHYENDGAVQMSSATTKAGTPIPDAATNGLDDGPPFDTPNPGDVGNGIIDDITEFDTQPPYPSPLRGIRITIRCYETSSQQIRQVTIEQDFLPE